MVIIDLIRNIRAYKKARADRIEAQKEYEELVARKQKEATDKKLKELDEIYENLKTQMEEERWKANNSMVAELERTKRMLDILTKDIEEGA